MLKFQEYQEFPDSTTYYKQWALLVCPAERPASVATTGETFIAGHTLFSELAHLA